MKPQVFPKEILDNSIIVQTFLLSRTKKIIYAILLLVFFFSLIALPFIFIDVYTSASGIIKPEGERIVLQSIQSGRVVYSNIKPHLRVKKGDTLLMLMNEQLEEREKLLVQKIQEKEGWISDLNTVLNFPKSKEQQIKTQKYKAEQILYIQQLHELTVRHKKAQQDLKLNRGLYEKQIIAKVEMEQIQFEFDLARNNVLEFKKRMQAQWQSEFVQEQIEFSELKSQLKQLREGKSQYVLTAPLDGALLNVIGIQINAYIVSGQPLAELSPESSLMVNCYVSPQNMGDLKMDTPVKFQIDAYNYNQWGWATGKIKTIGNDIELIQNQAVFQVQCSLNETELFLRSGVAGRLKKGMTVKAQFFRARRSLWQLLFDKVDDWFNPMLDNLPQT
ncbi:MAG: HlyD family efflux transporter periplasmic adaptor subunit [Flavobacteriaceae bacterium]